MAQHAPDTPSSQKQTSDVSDGSSSSGRFRMQPLLQRSEQAAIATILGIASALILIYLAMAYFRHGGMIDIDRAALEEIAFQVDVNQAEWPEFSLLPNVGESLARRIVAFRDQHGPFTSHEDLLRVSGIGPKTLEGMRPYLLSLDDVDTISSE